MVDIYIDVNGQHLYLEIMKFFSQLFDFFVFNYIPMLTDIQIRPINIGYIN